MLKLLSILVYVSIVVAMRPINPVKKTNLQNYPSYEIPNWVYRDVFSQNINKYKDKRKKPKETFPKRVDKNINDIFTQASETMWNDFLKNSKFS